MLLEGDEVKKQAFLNNLCALINNEGIDTEMNMPDYVLADYIYTSLENLRITSVRTDTYYGMRKLNGKIIKFEANE